MPHPTSAFAESRSLSRCYDCQVCGERLPPAELDLGGQPMCDDLVPVGDPRVAESFPIEISLCPNCLTGAQIWHINKEILFPSSYHYRPRFTRDVLDGMRELVEEAEAEAGDLSGRLVCDVGCNDGSLLSIFREHGATTCGIEPTGAASDACGAGHSVLERFFDVDSAREIVSRHGIPDVITFTNVFAHIEDLDEAIDALKEMTNSNSRVVIENHYLGAVLETVQFDTFYHEHPRTYSIRSFEFIARRLGGRILKVVFPKRYGGNIRVHIGDFGKQTSDPAFDLPDETGFVAEFSELQNFVDRWKQDAKARLRAHVAEKGPIWGKSFPGRASILVHLLGMDESIQPAVYEKPGSLKVGHYLPGTRIPIKSDDEWLSGREHPDSLLVWAWHIRDEVAGYLRKSGFEGDIYFPLPEFAKY